MPLIRRKCLDASCGHAQTVIDFGVADCDARATATACARVLHVSDALERSEESVPDLASMPRAHQFLVIHDHAVVYDSMLDSQAVEAPNVTECALIDSSADLASFVGIDSITLEHIRLVSIGTLVATSANVDVFIINGCLLALILGHNNVFPDAYPGQVLQMQQENITSLLASGLLIPVRA